MNQETKNALVLFAVILAAFFLIPQDALAQFGGGTGSFNNDPFEKGKTWLFKMGDGVSLVVTGGAFLGGMIVIALAMAGKLRADWAGKIAGGLAAMTGLTWLIESLVK